MKGTRGGPAESNNCPGPEVVREDSTEEGGFQRGLKAEYYAAQLHGEEQDVQRPHERSGQKEI